MEQMVDDPRLQLVEFYCGQNSFRILGCGFYFLEYIKTVKIVFADFSELIQTVMEINPQRSNLCTITAKVFFLKRHRREILFFCFTTHQTHDQQHNGDNPAHNHRQATTQQTPSHHIHTRAQQHNTTQHNITQNNTGTPQHKHKLKHISISSAGRHTSLQVVRCLHKNTKTNSFCVM